SLAALDPEVVSQLLSRARRRDPLERLSPRESEVLRLMAEGRSNTAIAQALVVSEGAVEKHVSNIFPARRGHGGRGAPGGGHEPRGRLAVLPPGADRDRRLHPAGHHDGDPDDVR
ncbi:MAG: response regulator transcription factor, partial [Kineosporiaceae bacterium]